MAAACWFQSHALCRAAFDDLMTKGRACLLWPKVQPTRQLARFIPQRVRHMAREPYAKAAGDVRLPDATMPLPTLGADGVLQREPEVWFELQGPNMPTVGAAKLRAAEVSIPEQRRFLVHGFLGDRTMTRALPVNAFCGVLHRICL
jgi:hypothetical protein